MERHGLLGRYKEGDRVNSRRGPGSGGPEREARLVRDHVEDKEFCAVDKEGFLVYPATVKRVDGVSFLSVVYDCHQGAWRLSRTCDRGHRCRGTRVSCRVS